MDLAAGACAAHLGRRRVLVVDDDVAMLQLIARVLRGACWHVEAVSCPRAAARLLERGGAAFDVLLTDVMMPELDGPGLAAHAVRCRPGIEVFFVSGFVAAPQGRDLPPGARVLAKPFSVRALRDLLGPGAVRPGAGPGAQVPPRPGILA